MKISLGNLHFFFIFHSSPCPGPPPLDNMMIESGVKRGMMTKTRPEMMMEMKNEPKNEDENEDRNED